MPETGDSGIEGRLWQVSAFYAVLALAYMMVLAYFSVSPGGSGMGFLFFSDKEVHLLSYLVLTLLLYLSFFKPTLAWRRLSRRFSKVLLKRAFLSAFASFAFGVAMEILQAVSETRTFSLYDMVANAVGVVAAAVLIFYVDG